MRLVALAASVALLAGCARTTLRVDPDAGPPTGFDGGTPPPCECVSDAERLAGSRCIACACVAEPPPPTGCLSFSLTIGSEASADQGRPQLSRSAA